MRSVAVGALIGAAVGVASAQVSIAGSGLVLIPWAVVGIALGSASTSRAFVVGTAYGFALSFGFLFASYDGNGSPIEAALVFVALSLFGAACGAGLAALGAGRSRRVAADRNAKV